jgi:hypothetical protein
MRAVFHEHKVKMIIFGFVMSYIDGFSGGINVLACPVRIIGKYIKNRLFNFFCDILKSPGIVIFGAGAVGMAS